MKGAATTAGGDCARCIFRVRFFTVHPGLGLGLSPNKGQQRTRKPDYEGALSVRAHQPSLTPARA